MDKSSGINYLNELINKFISSDLSADTFERLFTDFFDFEDVDEQQELMFFSSIRELLEHYSFSEKDITEYPEYYINESQLKEKIIKLKNNLQ